MKFIALLILLLVGASPAFTQSAVSSVDFKNALRPALTLPLTFNTKTAEQTTLLRLKETGYKPERSGSFLNKKNKEEGFYRFSGVVLPELDNQKLALYFKVDPLENVGENRSSITLLVSKGYDNFVSQESDTATFLASKNFLNTFVQNTTIYDIDQKMSEQTQNLVAAQKKWSELRDKQADGGPSTDGSRQSKKRIG